MKLVCAQTELNSALQLVSRAVASRPSHPVLANVLIAADAVTGKVSLTGFDLNLGIQTSFTADIQTSGAITLPAKLLGEIVSRFSSESPITLTSDAEGLEVELVSLGGKYQVRGMSSEDFPELPLAQTGTSLQINPEILIQSLRSTLFASSSDEAKQLLTGVHLSFKNNDLEAAATDGHRLAVLNHSNALLNPINSEAENNNIFSVTLPSRSLREVERMIGYWKNNEPISLFFDQGQVVLLSTNQVITSRTLDGTYPNYRQLIPDDFNKKIKLKCKPLIQVLERVAVLADQHNNVIKLSIEGNSDQLNINADAQDVGSGSEFIPAALEGDGIQIAFNVRYLLDGLKAINSDNIILQCNSPTTPVILCPDNDTSDFTYLIMPVQIRG